LLSILLPLAIHNALHPTRPGLIRRWLPVATIATALGLSLSRSAYIGLLVALVILLVGWPRRTRWNVLVISVVLAVGMAGVVPHLLRSVRSMFSNAKDDPSVASRTDSYSVAWQFFHESPWLGRGLGTFLPKYRIFDNNYLGLLVSTGVVGTAAFLALLATTVALLVRHRRRWSDERSRDLALSLVAGIVAGAVSLAFFDGFGFPMTMGTLFLTIGMAGALLRLRPEATPADLDAVVAAHLTSGEPDAEPEAKPAPDGAMPTAPVGAAPQAPADGPRDRTNDASASTSATST
jgi:O-antigen ligase